MSSTQEAPCKRCAAYSLLVKSIEEQLSFHRANAEKYREAERTLESERAANTRLTNDLVALSQSQEAQSCSLADVLAKLDEAKGCFDAAEVEGLSNILALQCGEEFFKLKDLVERRLMFAVDAIEEARSILSTAHGSERDKALEEAAKICWSMQARPEFEPEFHDKMLKQAEDRIRALKGNK